jgi:hypothetical protein
MNPVRRAAPPSDTEGILAETASRGRALYRLVRRLLDDFEVAAPWSLLYSPVVEASELRTRLDMLIKLVIVAPERVSDELDALAAVSESDDERAALREAEFYFTALHQMTAPDLRRLEFAVEQIPDAETLSRARADFLCELAADLKGKYSSAIMGAAAALVSDGRWLGFEVEEALFPEKREESERNLRLLEALEATVASIEEAIADFPWTAVLASWRRHRHVDRYALAELISLRAHLLRLLTVANRRALYSGDYHQLQGREILLGSRLRELESLHLRSLDVVPETQEPAATEIFTHLHQLLLETAALLDVEALRGLIGDELLRDLRHRGPSPVPREGSAGRLDALSLLLVEEDLKMFLKLLVGAVKKRASIAFRAGALVPVELVKPTWPQVERRRHPRPAPAPPKPLEPEVARTFARRLNSSLSRLTDPASAHWQAFQMVQKLQARLRVLPPTMISHELTPFLTELSADLQPLLDEASAAGAVPEGAAETLRACRRRLTESDLTGLDRAVEVGGDLARIARLLDSLKVAAEALSYAR